MCFFQKKTFATCMHPVLRPLTAEKNVNKGNALSCVVQLPLRLDCLLIKQKHFQSLFQAIASETLHETTSWSTCKLKKRECPSNRVKGSSVFFDVKEASNKTFEPPLNILVPAQKPITRRVRFSRWPLPLTSACTCERLVATATLSKRLGEIGSLFLRLLGEPRDGQ